MTEHIWVPITYPIDVLYKGDRQHTRVLAIEPVPIAIPHLDVAGGPVCSMLADNECEVTWYRAEDGTYYRTLIGVERRPMTLTDLADMTDRTKTWACTVNTSEGPESGHDQPGGFDNRFTKDLVGALLYEDIVAGAHPQWVGTMRSPRDIKTPEKDAALAAGLARAADIRRIGDIPVVPAALPTFALRILPMFPLIDIIPHVSTTHFVGRCIAIPFGIGELELARQCAETMRDPAISINDRDYQFEDRSNRLTVHDPDLWEHSDQLHQDFLFLSNAALSLHTMMAWEKFDAIPFGALAGYTGARTAAERYKAGDADAVIEAMAGFRNARPTGFSIFDIHAAASKIVGDMRASYSAEYDEALSGLTP